MMKKLMMLMVSGVTVLVLSGCGGGGGDVVVVDDGSTALFLVDQNNNSYGGVPYQCDGGPIEYTLPNGQFTFYPGEVCEFDFVSLVGNYDYDPLVDDIIYIVDDIDDGKGGIEYECDSFIAGTTNYDGSFEYDANDMCSFFL